METQLIGLPRKTAEIPSMLSMDKEASRHKCKQVLHGKDDENCVKNLRFAGLNSCLSWLLRCAVKGLEELNLINCEIGGNNIEALSINSIWPYISGEWYRQRKL